jgi:Domain of unknown function (DUF4397)
MSTRRLVVGIGLLCVSAAILLAAGCGGSSGQSELRVLNASPNEGSINILLDSATIASSIGYATATDYVAVKSGSRHLQIEPVGTTTNVIDTNVSIGDSTQTTVIVANYAANIGAVTLTDSTTAPTSGDAQIRVVNAAPNLAAADVYIVPPGADLSTTTPVAQSLAFEAATSYQNEAAGTYHIFLTVPGSTFAYLDSGPISFSAGQNRTVVVLISGAGGYGVLTLADLN